MDNMTYTKHKEAKGEAKQCEGKAVCETKEAAERYAAKMTKKWNIAYRAYECNQCHQWHLTTRV